MEHSGLSTSQIDFTPRIAPRESETAEAIDNAVDAYFADHSEKIATSIRTKMEEVQEKILDGLWKAIQSRYVQRIETLEASAGRNNCTLRDIQISAKRADDDLRRLAAGISGLIEETAVVSSD